MIRISGHPIVFGVDSVDLGGFIEVVRPSAFERTLDEGLDVVALRNHDSNYPLARTSAKTLTLTPDSRGVRATLDVDEDVSFVADLSRVIRRGDATGGSFAFSVVDNVWSLRNGIPFREVIDMRVSEVSVGVTFPAYQTTRLVVDTVEGRGLTDAEQRQFDWLKGYHRKIVNGMSLTPLEERHRRLRRVMAQNAR